MGAAMHVQAWVGAAMRAWVGLGLHLWEHFWCKQMQELVSFPPRTTLLRGCAKMSPFLTSPLLNKPASPQGKLGAMKVLGCLTPAVGPRLFPTRCRSKDMLPKYKTGFAIHPLSHWNLLLCVPSPSLFPAVPLTDFSIKSSWSPHSRESILPSHPRTQACFLSPQSPLSSRRGAKAGGKGSCPHPNPWEYLTQCREVSHNLFPRNGILPWATGAAGTVPSGWAGFWSPIPQWEGC